LLYKVHVHAIFVCSMTCSMMAVTTNQKYWKTNLYLGTYTLLQKYRHTKNLLETRVTIKILAHPCYPINFDWFSFPFCKNIFKMADSKKLRFAKLPILKKISRKFYGLVLGLGTNFILRKGVLGLFQTTHLPQ
jgi:hypothetical protein